jgi:hypothetical protein
MCNVDPATSSVVLTIVSALGVGGEPVLAEVAFEAVGEVEGNSPLRLSADPFVDPAGQPMHPRLQGGWKHLRSESE